MTLDNEDFQYYSDMIVPDFLSDSNGVLERPVSATGWFGPECIEVIPRCLFWQAQFCPEDIDRDFRRLIRPGRGMLETFVALEGKEDDRIARYALRWGLLGVRRFRLNGEHRKSWIAPGNFDCPIEFLNTETTDGITIAFGWEPLYIWRHWIPRIAGALRSASRLEQNKHPLQKDWQAVFHIPDCSPFAPSPKKKAARDRWFENFKKSNNGRWNNSSNRNSATQWAESEYRFRSRATDWSDELEYSGVERAWEIWNSCDPKQFKPHVARASLYAQIARWQQAAGVNLFLNPFKNRLEVRTECLFAGLIWQLMAAVCNSDGLAICSECGTTYRPPRKPTPGKRAYCKQCVRTGVPRRNATRAYRERKKQQVTSEDTNG